MDSRPSKAWPGADFTYTLLSLIGAGHCSQAFQGPVTYSSEQNMFSGMIGIESTWERRPCHSLNCTDCQGLCQSFSLIDVPGEWAAIVFMASLMGRHLLMAFRVSCGGQGPPLRA